jgi:hypothetical protein
VAEDHATSRLITKVDVHDPDLAVDTPMVIWHLHGFGHLTEGVSPEGGSTGGSGTGPPPAKPSALYVAVCDAEQHSPDLPGVLENGAWMGAFHEEAQAAFNDANAHADDGSLQARVYMSVGAMMFGPLSQHP